MDSIFLWTTEFSVEVEVPCHQGTRGDSMLFKGLMKKNCGVQCPWHQGLHKAVCPGTVKIFMKFRYVGNLTLMSLLFCFMGSLFFL